jgi:PTS system mannose-specific IID component
MGLAPALGLSAFIALLLLENYGYGYWMISRPIFAGPLIGLILGDVQTGLVVGGTVELMYLGVLPIGGSVPPNAQIAGILSTVFAITSGGNPEVGIALALPIGVLAQFLIMLAWNVNIILMHVADKYIEEGDYKKVERTHLCGLLVFYIIFFVTTFLAVYLGSDFVSDVVAALPDVVNSGLKVASGILPAVGMAMLLKMMDFRKYWPFFVLGFVAAVYMGLSVLAVSIAAVAIVFAIRALAGQKSDDDGFDDEDEEEVAAEPVRLLDKHILVQTFMRSFFVMTSINYERYESLGFCYAMIPALRKLYPDQEDFKVAMRRENEFFNCHPYTGNAVMGVALALEEQNAAGAHVGGEAISSTKTALMGPLSSIGDSVFKATFMTIFAAIGSSLALEGNILGPIVFIVPNVALNLASRWLFIKYGYEWGTKLVSKMNSSDLIQKFVEAATIVGMMVVGAMIVSFVKLSITAVWTIGGAEINLQTVLDSLMPSLLPLCLTLAYFGIMRKNEKGMYICIILSFVIGILGKAIGLF